MLTSSSEPMFSGSMMSLFAFHHARERATDDVLHDMLAGNLCRCTGYRGIVRAVLSVLRQRPSTPGGN